jgi:hypothetical protein
MSAYTEHAGPVEISYLSGIRYRLATDLIWRIGHEQGPAYLVPAGFIFDVSVPGLLRWLFDPHRKDFHKAAALHDHMLQSGWSRITAAAEFHNALKADGVGAARRLAMLMAVLLWKFE